MPNRCTSIAGSDQKTADHLSGSLLRLGRPSILCATPLANYDCDKGCCVPCCAAPILPQIGVEVYGLGLDKGGGGGGSHAVTAGGVGVCGGPLGDGLGWDEVEGAAGEEYRVLGTPVEGLEVAHGSGGTSLPSLAARRTMLQHFRSPGYTGCLLRGSLTLTATEFSPARR